MQTIRRLFFVFLSAATPLAAQEWRLAQEATFRVDVARPGAVAARPDGGLILVDDHDRRLVLIDPAGHETGAIQPGETGWQSVKDLAVLPSGDMVLLDSHLGKTWRLDAQGNVLSSQEWSLPPREYLDQILLASDEGLVATVRGMRVGPPGPRLSRVAGMDGQGRRLFTLGPFADGVVFHASVAAGRDTLGEYPDAIRDLWAGQGVPHRLYQLDGRTGVLHIRDAAGAEVRTVDTGLRPRPNRPEITPEVLKSAEGWPDSLGAARALWVDGQGRLWVATGQVRQERGLILEAVLLFSGEGKRLGSLDLRDEPAAFFQDRVFSLRADRSRGQTVVRRYRLVPPESHIPEY